MVVAYFWGRSSNRVIGAAVLAMTLAAWLGSAPAIACGGGGVASISSATVANSQRIFMSVRASGTTDIVAQITVPQTVADYGVLIPVPGEPTIDSEPVSSADLNALDVATAPVFSHETDSGGSGCGCIAAGAGDDDDSSSGAPKRGVMVGTAVAIGPVVAVQLSGDSGEAVRGWLTENGFSIPTSDTATFDRYVGDGNYFIAIRRQATGAPGTPTSVGVHYTLAGDHRKLSLGFTRIGAASQLAFTLFLAAPQTVGPSEPFKALTLNDLDGDALLRTSYSQVLATKVQSLDSKAFILESSTPASALQNTAPGLLRFIDDGAVITRATTVINREALTDDVIFATPYQDDVPSRRALSVSPTQMRQLSMGSLGFLVLGGALRRRTRKRQPRGNKR